MKQPLKVRLAIGGLWVALFLMIGGFIAEGIWSRNMVCKTYYPELNRWACFSQFPGLPPQYRGKK